MMTRWPASWPPRRAVGAFLGQHCVPGTAGGELCAQELVRQPVARLAQQVRLAAAGAQLEQPTARLGGQLAGQRVIIGGHRPGSCHSSG